MFSLQQAYSMKNLWSHRPAYLVIAGCYLEVAQYFVAKGIFIQNNKDDHIYETTGLDWEEWLGLKRSMPFLVSLHLARSLKCQGWETISARFVVENWQVSF